MGISCWVLVPASGRNRHESPSSGLHSSQITVSRRKSNTKRVIQLIMSFQRLSSPNHDTLALEAPLFGLESSVWRTEEWQLGTSHGKTSFIRLETAKIRGKTGRTILSTENPALFTGSSKLKPSKTHQIPRKLLEIAAKRLLNPVRHR